MIHWSFFSQLVSTTFGVITSLTIMYIRYQLLLLAVDAYLMSNITYLPCSRSQKLLACDLKNVQIYELVEEEKKGKRDLIL